MWLPLRFGMCAGKPRAPRCFAPAIFFFFWSSLRQHFFYGRDPRESTLHRPPFFPSLLRTLWIRDVLVRDKVCTAFNVEGRAVVFITKFRSLSEKLLTFWLFFFLRPEIFLAWSVWLRSGVLRFHQPVLLLLPFSFLFKNSFLTENVRFISWRTWELRGRWEKTDQLCFKHCLWARKDQNNLVFDIFWIIHLFSTSMLVMKQTYPKIIYILESIPWARLGFCNRHLILSVLNAG